jgi:predicted S18 family serine protease
LNQYSFAFDAEGNIDGPSAGGLFTASTLALILGDSLQSEVTMTGTINPDGSIGPVGGIPLKVQAAHEQGKRRVVIPAGQLTPQLRDLETELGIEVQEAADVYQAYEFLTDKPLPLPMGFADVAPQMSTAGSQAIQALTEDIHTQYQSERSAFNAASLPEDLKPIDQAAQDSFSASRRAANQGNLPSAYSTGRTALVQLRLVQNLEDTQTALEAFGDRPWDVSGLTENWEPLIQETETLLQSLETAEVKTANDAITAIRAFGHLILIIGLNELAQQEVAVLKTNEAARDPDSEAYRRALFYLAIAPTLAAQQLNEAQDALQLRDIPTRCAMRFKL